MAYQILKSSTECPLLFFMVQSADHLTALTSASPTVTISKNGGSFASPSGAVTEIANGWYKVAGNATDTGTAGPIALHATATSGDPFDGIVAEVVAYDPQDSVRGGMTALPNAAAGASGGLPLSVDTSGRVDVLKINGTSQTARDLGASVLISSGTGTGQLSVTSGVIDSNVKSINSIAATSVTTVSAYQGTTQPVNFTGTGASALAKSDVTDWNGTAVSSPATAGIPEVNVKNMNNVAATSITTVGAYQGTTQPINFTAAAGSALAKVDVTDIATAAVATGSAQLGVNVVNMAGSALSTTAAQIGVNLINIAGSAVSTSTAQLGVNAVSVAAGAINNAAFNADVATAGNTIPLAAYAALNTAFTDATSLNANSLLDRLRTYGWILRNKIAVTDANGNTVIYKDDSTTAGFTVAGMLTDDSTTTTRLRAA
jgi:hypothetical protein